jgi:hypothetical protein
MSEDGSQTDIAPRRCNVVEGPEVDIWAVTPSLTRQSFAEARESCRWCREVADPHACRVKCRIRDCGGADDADLANAFHAKRVGSTPVDLCAVTIALMCCCHHDACLSQAEKQ